MAFRWKYLDAGVPRRLTLDTLPRPDRRDYGFCVWRGWDMCREFSDAPEIVVYDDDTEVCICGDEDCYGDSDFAQSLDYSADPEHFPEHFTIDEKIICSFVGLRLTTAMSVNDDFQPLTKLPDDFSPPSSNDGHFLRGGNRSGWIYVVCLNPDLSLHRVKIGWSSKPIQQRLRSYRTTSPNLLLLGLWESVPQAEAAALRACDGRIRDTEVFDTLDPFRACKQIEEAVMRVNTEYDHMLAGLPQRRRSARHKT